MLQTAKFPNVWLIYGSQVHTANTQLVTYLYITSSTLKKKNLIFFSFRNSQGKEKGKTAKLH